MDNVIGSRIKERRSICNKTQEELGLLVHVKKQTISKWEKGINMPDPQTLKLLANILDCSIDYLVGNTDHLDMRIIEDDNLKVTYNNNYPYDLTPEQAERVFKLLKEYRLDIDGIIRDIKNGTIKDEL